MSRLLNSAVVLALALATPAFAQDAATGRAIYQKASPSMVAVSYVWEREVGKQELVSVGVVVGEDGTVIFPLAAVPAALPDIQLKEFKVIVPKVDTDHEELDAVFLGRDERHNVAFVKIKDASKKLPVLTFTDKKVDIAEPIYSVGVLPKESGYKTFLSMGTVAALLRGETPSILMSGALADVGGVAFNSGGEAIGYVFPQPNATLFLEPRDPRQSSDNTTFFVPASEILPAIAKPPVEGKPAPLPYTGIFGMTGLSKDLAEVMDLKGKPAAEIGDVIPGSPAEKAGLLKGMIIIEIDGQKLEQADQPEELSGIISKKIVMKNPGDTITFTVIEKKGAEPKKIAITLTERPAQPNTAPRFYAEDLGYTVRDAVFLDLYSRKLPLDSKGVVIDFIKPQGAAATAQLKRGDMVTKLNDQPVTDVAAFKTEYEAFRKDKAKEALVLQVVRAGATQIIRIEPPQ